MDKQKREILLKVYLVYCIMVLLGLIILGRVIYIQVAEGDYWREKAEKFSLRYETIEANRGNILAADGSLLAASIPKFELRIDAGNTNYTDEFFYDNVDSLAWHMARYFGDRNTQEYKKMLIKGRKTNNRYLLLKRNLTYDDLKTVRRFPIFRLGKYKGGIITTTTNKRELPFKWLAFRTLGWDKEGDDNDVGLEGAYSSILQGNSGRRLMQRIGNGAWRPLNQHNEIEPADGSDLVTSIDINIQDVAEDALMRQLIAHEADHGCVILMEVKTGFIVAIANLGKNSKGIYEEKYNYAIGESSEPGSTFKLASLMAALDDGLVTLSDTVDTKGGMTRFANRIMRDSHYGGYGRISARRAFELSSNVGISKIVHKAYQNKPQAFIDRLYAMRLNQPLGLDISGEGMPQIKDTKHKYWSKVSLPWMSIGYEVALTPLQILSFYNAIANNGTLVRPQFIREIRCTGKPVQQFKPIILQQSIVKNKATIDSARSLLEGVVSSGTATHLRNKVYKIAGKTGTAQIAQTSNGYNKTNYKASFVGYFPADNPQYSMIVVINNPSKGVYYGGSIAGPVFKEVADKVYATRLDPMEVKNDSLIKTHPVYAAGHSSDITLLLKNMNFKLPSLKQTTNWAVYDTRVDTAGLQEKVIDFNLVPDVRGMGARDAVYLLEKAGFSVLVRGKGKVKNQSPNAGSIITEGDKCIIDLG
ncbi:MAG: penicillin-binding protein [Lentimicrobium sp.]|jgi:cell division protein FtsI (penicillin-binding protein 3)|nr:penicillin-binding protein [Lentimicrobium sp.]